MTAHRRLTRDFHPYPKLPRNEPHRGSSVDTDLLTVPLDELLPNGVEFVVDLPDEFL